MKRLWRLCCACIIAGSLSCQGEDIEELEISDFDRDHWSFQPLVKPPIPEGVANAANPIDRFVFAELKRVGLKPLPPASRQTLLRRVKFDLLGLPPSVSEIKAFGCAESPLSVADLIDQFLASPRYGERWAQHWLDLARFAETDGFEHDKVRTKAWKYRDWVIRAFNDDLPYDRFLQLQIAGRRTSSR